jgi:Tfp pilus assembly protein PilE
MNATDLARMSAAHRPRGRDDSGATLIEILVAVLVLAVISLPLGNAIIAVLHNSDVTSGRLKESHDAQLAAAYWAQDVAGVGTRDTVDPYNPQPKPSVEQNVAGTAGTYPCGTATTPTAIVRFAADDPSPSSTTLVVVAYAAVPVGTRYSLHRIRCAGSTVPVTDIVLARDLVAVPVVRCDGSLTCPGLPSVITLAMRVQDPTNEGLIYDVTLDGQRRQT